MLPISPRTNKSKSWNGQSYFNGLLRKESQIVNWLLVLFTFRGLECSFHALKYCVPNLFISTDRPPIL